MRSSLPFDDVEISALIGWGWRMLGDERARGGKYPTEATLWGDAYIVPWMGYFGNEERRFKLTAGLSISRELNFGGLEDVFEELSAASVRGKEWVFEAYLTRLKRHGRAALTLTTPGAELNHENTRLIEI